MASSRVEVGNPGYKIVRDYLENRLYIEKLAQKLWAGFVSK